jgi:hypothetical protein
LRYLCCLAALFVLFGCCCLLGFVCIAIAYPRWIARLCTAIQRDRQTHMLL